MDTSTHRTILRVEHREDGQGPYWGPRERWPDELCNAGDRHPLPRDTAPSDWQYKYGFHSEYQFDMWWSAEEKRLLRRNGFRLSRYVVPTEHVLDTNAQVIFNAKYSKRIADDAIPD